jgi:hypothetical protein
MKFKPHPSQEELHERFEYCDDGNFIRKNKAKPRTNRIRKEKIAGGLNSIGYVTVGIRDVRYLLHRLVWIYHNGDIPNGMIVDHIDRNPSNNRIENLRLASRSLNAYNSKLSISNTSGIRGVSFVTSENKWRAGISVNGKQIILGEFHTIEEATISRKEAEIKYYGEFTPHE